MKIFLDSANLRDVDEVLGRGVASGITTNPSILSNEPKTDFVEHIGKIARLCEKHRQLVPLSIEVFSVEPAQMLEQAMSFCESIAYKNLNIKIPIGWDELKVIHALSNKDITVNCT